MTNSTANASIAAQAATAEPATAEAVTFSSLGLVEPLCRALASEGYTTPTPIQVQAIGPLLAGRDLLGIAQTGTGKTAAFGLPLLQRLSEDRQAPVPKCVRSLILAPTRELAIQIEESLATYGRHLGLRRAVIFGGVGQGPQVKAIGRGLDILVATPGRLLDLINQRHLRLERTEVLVLDEADRMLDMGFVRDVRKIVQMLPRKRQSLLFSATMPKDIAELAKQMLNEPQRVEVTPEKVTVEKIAQSVHFVAAGDKRELLVKVMKDPSLRRVIVFTRTKHGADRVTKHLNQAGIAADAIHGDKAQGARQRALANFREGKVRVMVATDIAARGIDVDGVTHVVNFELPNVAESYVHRIGRTARAGAEGAAISFCAPDERPYLRDIERLTKVPLLVAGSHAPSERAQQPRPQGQPGREQRPQGARPQGARPNGQKPHWQKPNGQKADGGRSANGAAANDRGGEARPKREGAAGQPAGKRRRSRNRRGQGNGQGAQAA